MQHAIINAMKCMRAIKDRIARPVYQLANHHNQPIYPHGVSTEEIIALCAPPLLSKYLTAVGQLLRRRPSPVIVIGLVSISVTRRIRSCQNPSDILVHIDGGIAFPVVDLIRRSTAAYLLKCRFPCETDRSQVPRRQQAVCPFVGREMLATGFPNDWLDQTMSYQLIQTTSFAMHPRLLIHYAPAGSTWPPPDYEQLTQLWTSPLLIQLPFTMINQTSC
ncbi:hypothetical protein F511_29208 [Dorcoceras hygrometricum]|uniref:Uncharacterized protein n=1 Tax=Dorcoceras hygrometricum TaxID=472368 RepID=A0A2Z7BQC3_9LAMI|nr:hypothetical protein F511_29208 [Dorcoceras hygrometricum]